MGKGSQEKNRKIEGSVFIYVTGQNSVNEKYMKPRLWIEIYTFQKIMSTGDYRRLQ